MRPDENQQNGRVGTSQTGVRSYVHTPPSRDPQYRQQQAAADIVRNQLDEIYSKEDQQASVDTPQPATQQQPVQQPQQQNEIAVSNPYERTHTPQTTIQPEQWKSYHSAWQDYYKRYYEGYYTQQVASAKRSLELKQTQTTAATPTSPIGSNAPSESSHQEQQSSQTGPLTRKQAMEELRSRLLNQVEASAKKARKSRHFIPITAALAVLLVFGFIQYNQVLIANVKAYVTPGSIDPQNIIVDPASTVSVGKESRLIIPKINVDTPVFYDIPTTKTAQDKAMENGVAHFAIPGANSHPGQVGNTVLSGHSSNDVFAAGDYKFIFMQLDKLKVGDTIYANYKGKRFTYVVTKKQEVQPNNVQALVYDTDKPVMTLITCTPLGTALRRLLVTAEQVYPVTSEAAPTPTTSDTPGETTIPGQGQPTFFERLFGAS